MKKSKLLRAAVFLILLILAFQAVQSPFRNPSDDGWAAMKGFHRELPGSLDAVYIGGSDVHAFWETPLGWADRGIAVWSFSFNSLPTGAVPYLIKEALKTQPDALYIISLNCMKNYKTTPAGIHSITDYMPPSLNKWALIRGLSEQAGYSLWEQLEYFFPIIRYHSRWSELESWEFTHEIPNVKAGLLYSVYNEITKNQSSVYQITEDESSLPEEYEALLAEILALCDQNNLRVLFVTVPQAIGDPSARGRLNTMERMVREHGYPCLDYLAAIEELGIQPETDFYNTWHTNVHGSLKYIAALESYLVENYGFTDKRGQPGWESWDEAAVNFTDVIGPWSLPFERAHAARDYGLAAPKLSKPAVDGSAISLSWAPTEEADGYEVYRKCAEEELGYWLLLAELGAGADQYTDTGLNAGQEYTYTVVPITVVPIRRVSGEKLYGCFSYSGVSAKVN